MVPQPIFTDPQMHILPFLKSSTPSLDYTISWVEARNRPAPWRSILNELQHVRGGRMLGHGSDVTLAIAFR